MQYKSEPSPFEYSAASANVDWINSGNFCQRNRKVEISTILFAQYLSSKNIFYYSYNWNPWNEETQISDHFFWSQKAQYQGANK